MNRQRVLGILAAMLAIAGCDRGPGEPPGQPPGQPPRAHAATAQAAGA